MSVISQYQVVIPGQTITAALWNGMELNIINNGLIPGGIEDYSSTDGQMQTMTDPFPASSISRPTSLAGEVERIRWQLDNIIGGTYWYEDPAVDLSTMKTRFDAHTHDGTSNNGPQIAAAGIASDAVTTAKILDANVTDVKLASDSVTTAKILNSNVTLAKLASNSVDENKITTSVAGDGLSGGGGTPLSVSVDNSTIEISSDQIRVKDGGIGANKLAPTYVLTTRPAFFAYNSTKRNNVTGNSVTYTVPFDTEVFDQGSNYNNSTYTFTAPVAGVYIFTMSVHLSGLTTSTHTVAHMNLVATGQSYRYSHECTSWPFTDFTFSRTVVIKMALNDTASVTVNVNAGSQDVDVDAGGGVLATSCTEFSGALLF